ncbi:MAG: N-acetylglucosamine-6-phosphate deacetylase [bacterium]|nr:N-acetylglucosamine-6-phosphate deacetylase [bacterium]
MNTTPLLIRGARPFDLGSPVDALVTETSVVLDPTPDPGTIAVDGTGLILAPGFVDIQINGGFGNDFTTDPESIWQVGARLPEQGTTQFVPTIITAPPEAVTAALATLRAGPPAGYAGARPLGLHIEGPMISPQRRGTHPVEHLRPIDHHLLAGWTREAGVTLVTLAPEMPGATEAISQLVAAGVIVSLGHSAATADQARVGLGAGATHGTHLFNAMPALHHREPGLAGVLLTDKRASAAIIVDGIHVAPEMVAVAWKTMGRERLILMTDAMAGMGMPNDQYEIGGVIVNVDEAGARNLDGALAGSTLTMDQAVRNLAGFTGCSPDDAIAAASVSPRSMLGMDSALTASPDLVLLNQELEVAATIVAGKVAFDARA